MDSGVYPASAVERAMKVQELIVRAIDGRVKWYQAAEILGISDRQMRRWKVRYECGGYDGLFDRRRQRPSPKRVPLAMVREVLTLFASATSTAMSCTSTRSCRRCTGFRSPTPG